MTTLPPRPNPPPAGATSEQIAVFERSLAVYSAAAAALHAESLAAIAAALSAGVKVQMNMGRREMIWAMVQEHPQVTGVTDLNVVDMCTKAVDAFMSRFPEV